MGAKKINKNKLSILPLPKEVVENANRIDLANLELSVIKTDLKWIKIIGVAMIGVLCSSAYLIFNEFKSVNKEIKTGFNQAGENHIQVLDRINGITEGR